ncbi:hypothetical protein D9615_001843 [Tricholomella constricta]|uniref:SRR1-like domain-containing protein n=1 Tax=Tricholomella constricta TaxID=117010 RepID=A0A8H5MB28_9AGAR|nr:hypothetical protein D9615_001843 [Tricholomella constricta]
MNGTSSIAAFYTDFTPVNRKKRRNRAIKKREPLVTVLQRLHEELGQDDWLPQCQQILVESLASAALAQTSLEVLCLGLGSPSTSPNARVQLAFLLAICDSLNIDRAKVSLYDPVFTAEDASLLAELQVQLLTENKASPIRAFRASYYSGAALAIVRPTLCFMPHCDMELYESLLKANWSRSSLRNLLLVANRLADYIDSNPRHRLETGAPFLLNLAPSLECYPFPASRPWPTAFNNTAVQFMGLQTGVLALPE